METNKRLLTDTEQDNCTPSEVELVAYLATPDDAVASSIKNSITKRHIAKCVLYGANIAKAQDTKTREATIKEVFEKLAKLERKSHTFSKDRCISENALVKFEAELLGG